MSPEEIIDAYNVVAKDVQDRAANEAARIGNAQRSLGPLAARVASPSGQTYGLANYTYDRTMRPVIDTTVSGLVTTGYGAALDNNLKASLRAAKNRYEDAKNRYTVASSGSGSNNNTQNTGGSKEQTDQSFTGEDKYASSEAGKVIDANDNDGDGTWSVTVSDGKGGYETYEYKADNYTDAMNQYYRNYNIDGSEKSYAEKNISEWADNPDHPLHYWAQRQPGVWHQS